MNEDYAAFSSVGNAQQVVHGPTHYFNVDDTELCLEDFPARDGIKHIERFYDYSNREWADEASGITVAMVVGKYEQEGWPLSLTDENDSA